MFKYPSVRTFTSQTQPQSKKILEGYRIIDASRILVGAFGSMMLADMGAEVIKIEQPGMGDETRKWGPPFRGKDSTYFISINRNKKSITLDLKSEEGLKILNGLVSKADIFMTNFVPNQRSKLQIDYQDFQTINPKLIYASVQGFPQKSIWENKAAFDLTIQAMSGQMHCTGDPDGSPFKVGYAVTDILTGMTLLQGILGAIIHRERTGEGQFINTSLLEANLFSLSYVVSSWLNGQTEYNRMGNSHPNIAPYSVYRTKDQDFIVIGVATDSQFEKLCSIIKMEVRDEYKSNSLRCKHRTQLNAEIDSILIRDWIKVDLIKAMTEKAIPFSEIKSVKQLLEEPEIASMGMTGRVNTDKYATNERQYLEYPKNPLHFSRSELSELKEPPLLGENTDEILRELLGYNQEEIQNLRSKGVI
ncbi:hypothetical protein FGO68_gene10343 [Halteria grandinella]|uniref:CoA transferase n=1 Tax=Halteria grandinella TaxID=5974 RepID=A0A8J8NQ50_HALGN|nr:hypothetical protein FGO68_gene10343 [Halteria grandinella]